MIKTFYIIGLILIAILPPTLAEDTIVVNGEKKKISLSEYLYLLEDKDHSLTIDNLLFDTTLLEFGYPKNENLNFEFSPSTYWLKFNIVNHSAQELNYILEIANPDLNYVNFFEIRNGKLIRRINTGELMHVESRGVYHRNYLFTINLEPEESFTYYISVRNNGNPLIIPIQLVEKRLFERLDTKREMFNWFIQGILLFILLFNLYLFRISREKINLYYSLNVVFVIITMLVYDGYFYLLDPSVYIEKLKWFYPCFYVISLISFIQAFIQANMRRMKLIRVLQPFKIIAFIMPFFYFFSFPYSLGADIGIPLLILFFLIINISIALLTLDKQYSPSILLLFAFVFMFVGMFIHQLKELNVISSGFFVDNSIKLGFTTQSVLLTFAVLERFRINQENAKKTIEENYQRIEQQNKEFEIVNAELEKLSIVASETENGIAIYNIDGVLEWCNKRFEEYYHVTLVDLIESNKDHITDIVPNEDIAEYFKKCIQKDEPVLFETHAQTRKNKKIWVQTTLSPFKRLGSIEKIIAIDADISNLKKYERNLEKAKEKAEEADRLKTVFLGNMSHEIRTPLNGIIGFSDLLFNTDMDQEKQKKYLQLIKNNGEQLMNIIEDIVDISLIESNQLRINPKKINLRQVFKETVDFFEPYRSGIGKEHVVIKQQIELPDTRSTIVTDAFRLKQVLNNLLKNAFKFTDDGTVCLGCNVQEDRLLVYVEDTGIGVSPPLQQQIFERFRQGEETLTRKYGGNGLGLAISKGIMEKLGGTIWLDTEYTNGARFCFTLPLADTEMADEQINNDSALVKIPEKAFNKKFLVVEDHDSSYTYLEEVLQPFKASLTRAVNGKEAVEMVQAHKYDIVLMDISLPEQDGISAVQQIRKFNTSIPIIAQTAHAMLSKKDEILKSGFNDIVTKPIDKKLLIQKINHFF